MSPSLFAQKEFVMFFKKENNKVIVELQKGLQKWG